MSKFLNCLFGLTLLLLVFLFNPSFALATAPLTPVINSIIGNTQTPVIGNDPTPDVVISGLSIGDDIKVYSGGTEVGSIIGVGGSVVTITTSTLSEGPNTLTAIAYEVGTGDASLASTSFSYNLDLTPPAVPSIVSVVGSTLSPVTANDSTPDVVVSGLNLGDTVKVYAGGTLVATSTNVGATTVTLTTSVLSEATHSITATATDLAGNASLASTSFSYNLDLTPPAVPSIVSVVGSTLSPFTANDSTPDVVVSGLNLGDTVKVYTGGTLVATSTNVGATTVTLTASTLPEGPNSITVTSTDTFGNESSMSPVFTYNVDTIAPSAPIISSIIGSTASPVFGNNQTPNIVVSDLTIGDSVKVYSGGTEVGSAASVGGTSVTITTSSLSLGSNLITATSTDSAGNTSIGSSAVIYNIDTTPPTVVISAGVTSPTNISPISVTFTFNKVVTGFTSNSIVIGNGVSGVLNTSNNTIFTMNITPSADGLLTVDVGSTVAIDQFGNGNSASSQFAVNYDSIAPSTPSIISVDGKLSSPTSGTNATPSVVVNGLTVGDTLKIYSGGTQVSSQAIGATLVTITTSTLPQGSNSITAKAFDNAGNISVGSSAFIYSLDSSIPSVVISAGISGPTNISPIPITIRFSEPVTGFTSNDIIVGNGTTSALTTSDNTVFNFDLTPSANGLVTVDIGSTVALDAGGNGNTPASQFAISYDNIAPNAPSIYSVGGILVSPGSNNIVSPDIVLKGLNISDTVQVFVGGTQVASQLNIGATSITINIPALSAGPHTITATATDAAGNTSLNSMAFVYSADPTMPNQPIIDSVDGSTLSPVVSNDSTPNVVISNLTIGDDVKLYVGSTQVGDIVGVGATRVTITSPALSQGVYSVTAIAYGAGTGNASNTSNTFTLTIDLSGPSVTKIGNGNSDYLLSVGSTASIVFNRSLSSVSKTAVENAITAGADNVPSFSWNGSDTALTLTAVSLSSTFANDVTADVTDTNGNVSLNLLLIDSALDPNQIDAGPSVTVGSTQSQVVITGSAATSITVPSDVTNATINVDSLLSGNTATLPSININAATSIGAVSVAFPTQTHLTSDVGWSGIINIPTIRANNTVTVTPDSGNNANISSVIEIGADDLNLTFDKGVRIGIAGQGGKTVGFYRNGVFTKIITVCKADDQATGDSISAGSECTITVGSDMVIWTKHFTRFITYSQSSIDNGGGNNNSNSNGPSGPPGAPSCGNQAPGGIPVLFRIERVNKKTAKLHFTPTSGPNSYYYVAYGKTAGSETYGTTFDMGDYPGEISFTVGNLSSSANYYFKVRGGNGCMPGVWSNNLSIKDKNIKIPKPTPVKKVVVKKAAPVRTTSPIKQ